MNYVNENDNGTPWADDSYFPWYRNVMTLKKVHFIQNGYKFLNRQTYTNDKQPLKNNCIEWDMLICFCFYYISKNIWIFHQHLIKWDKVKT